MCYNLDAYFYFEGAILLFDRISGIDLETLVFYRIPFLKFPDILTPVFG